MTFSVFLASAYVLMLLQCEAVPRLCVQPMCPGPSPAIFADNCTTILFLSYIVYLFVRAVVVEPWDDG